MEGSAGPCSGRAAATSGERVVRGEAGGRLRPTAAQSIQEEGGGQTEGSPGVKKTRRAPDTNPT